jgi:hypothetical protein
MNRYKYFQVNMPLLQVSMSCYKKHGKQENVQDLIAAIFGNSADPSSATPDMREYVSSIYARAYYTIHGQHISTADPAWANAINATCLQLYKDPRIATLDTRALLHCFENVIRVSEEHLKISKRHAAMALNVFYLKETALDALDQVAAMPSLQAASPNIISTESTHTGRVNIQPLPQSN